MASDLSNVPSDTPTQLPSDTPTDVPSAAPSASPSAAPSASPSVSPSASPSASPTVTPGGGGGGGSYRPQPNNSAKTVSDQPGLDAALADSRVKTVTIKDATGTLTIAEGTYNKDIIVNAPQAHIENEGKFNSVTIEAISESTWVEKLKNAVNSIKVKAEKAHIKLESGAKPEITVDTPAPAVTPNITITVAKGSNEGTVTINAVVKIAIKKDTTAGDATGADALGIAVNVAISSTSGVGGETKTATITSEVKATIDTTQTAATSANVAIALEAGAEGSTVKVDTTTSAANSSNVGIVNSTTDTVTVETSDNKKVEVVKDGTFGSDEVVAEATAEQQLTNAIDAIKADMAKQTLTGLEVDATIALSADSVISSVASGASISWKSSDSSVLSVSGATATVVKQPDGADVSVTLTATVTLADGKSTKDTTFEVKVKGKGTTTPPETDKTVEIELSTVSYTAATASAVSGSSITVTATPTVKVDGTADSTASSSAKITYALGDSNSSQPDASAFKDTELTLGSGETKYLWIKVVATVDEKETIAYFVSSAAVTSTSNSSFAVTEKKNS